MSEDAFIEDMDHFWPLLAPIPTTSLPCAIFVALDTEFRIHRYCLSLSTKVSQVLRDQLRRP